MQRFIDKLSNHTTNTPARKSQSFIQCLFNKKGNDLFKMLEDVSEENYLPSKEDYNHLNTFYDNPNTNNHLSPRFDS